MECLVKCLQFGPIVRHIRSGVCIQPRVPYGHRYRYLDRQRAPMLEIEVCAVERAYKVYGCVQSCHLGVNRVSDLHINLYYFHSPTAPPRKREVQGDRIWTGQPVSPYPVPLNSKSTLEVSTRVVYNTTFLEPASNEP
jgi:hypothetical protein